ncbi:hypothetical protein HYDPIDRAFT_83371 [Hydnomerulius pinastri MD-312]|nr:hypothetical protein HYDPIDRAFT_83371 [Hydnomerulius pinastri MD-312]
MIIPDEDDTQKIKDPPVATPTIRYPERAAGRRPFSPLPDYETSQALAYSGFNDSQATIYKPPPRRRLIDSRFWRAALSSLAVYIFLTIVIGIPIIVTKERQEQQKYPYNSLNYAVPWPDKNSGTYYAGNINNISSPTQAGVDPICNNWTMVDFPDGTSLVEAIAEHHVSPNSEFSLTSNASYLEDFGLVQGDFYVGINPNSTVQEAVMSIQMQSPNHSVFNRTFVCFALSDNLTDLSLYVPDNLSSKDVILFNITLLFPQSPIPSRVDNFATFLPMFYQHFGSFGDYVNFKKVSIEGPISRITVESLQADKMLIDTSMEPIFGSFYATDSLAISTIMAPVHANITLYNDPKAEFPTFLSVNTGNSNLTANVIVLAPNKEPPNRPNFIANLRTFYGTLTASLVHDPTSPPTVIKVTAENDLGPSSLTLDQLFQGVFQASTKQASAKVSQGSANGTDPWGSGMERTWDLDFNSTARMYGWIGWGDKPAFWTDDQQGQVDVQTSLANVTLSFDG